MEFSITWKPKSQTEYLSLARLAYNYATRLDLTRVTIERNAVDQYQVFTNWNSCGCPLASNIAQAFINAEQRIVENQSKPARSCYHHP